MQSQVGEMGSGESGAEDFKMDLGLGSEGRVL